MEKLRVLDLCSGIGGIALGFERTGGFETTAFCEIEDFPRRVLKKHWPDVPCFKDIRELGRGDIDETIDVIAGGYPCQPFSVAGNRLGEKDDRHLWPEFSRLLDEFRPPWFLGENVFGHVSMGLDTVLSDLEAKGYTTRAFIIPACAVDAKHRRDRVWILGHSEYNGSLAAKVRRGAKTSSNDNAKGQKEAFEFEGASQSKNDEDVANSYSQGLEGRQKEGNIDRFWKRGKEQSERCPNNEWRTWPTEPRMGRVANGVPNRMDRLKSLGNAVVPQIPELIGYAILEAEKQRRAA